ncbi:MAG: UDP-N-acetylmuramoyl-L-alanyl-D-glutamate--2,6-diaminopimelate ligase [Chloroflexi bacterium]|nr:UDP-N-acetylmuramoyl-L-alanyl-D-glutamate--2,6-diaminopimelate ligase [Chloroflexota bacterium]
MKLKELAPRLGAHVVAGPEIEVTRVVYDSRRAQSGDLFVGIPGAKIDGAEFASQAVERGAAAVAAERALAVPDHVGMLLVPSARRALGESASALLGNPSERMRVVGVTGTDGKTTTARLTAGVLGASGRRVGWLTTVDMAIADVIFPNPFERTTPEASDLQEALANLVGGAVEDVVVEVSSHALALERVAGCAFDAAVFTNLAPEHLDFHGTMEAYAETKARLFASLDSPTAKRWSRMGVVNADDPASVTMVASSPAGIVSYAVDAPADVRAEKIRLGPDSTSFNLVTPIGEVSVWTPLRGRHNVYNFLAAAAVGLGWGVGLEAIAQAAEAASLPPGRLQRVDRGQPFEVIVDFAHTPQALGATLATLRDWTSGRLYLVFGMAGRRDARNRPLMGRVAAQGADFFFISLDDPIDEDPVQIAREVGAGAQAAGAIEGTGYAVQLDRRIAIQSALKLARPGDTVVLAGKGHEARMLIGDRSEPWSDLGVVTELLAQLGYSS